MVIVVAIFAGLCAYAIGATVVRHARRLGLIDVPNQRSSHETPTPRGGGIGIVCASVGGMLLLPMLDLGPPIGALTALVAGGLIIAAVSLADDLGGVQAPLRLLVHAALGVGAVIMVGPIAALDLGAFGTVPLGWGAAPLTALWIAGIINAYNFMDGIDGLAAGQAITTGGAWVVIGLGLGRPDLAACALIVAAASAGFLVHNWAPARLFMGDVGSAFLGFTLGLLAVIAARIDAGLATVGVVLLWPFVFDTALTLLRRVSRLENLFAAHRTHFYQRLIATGWTPAATLRLYLAMGLLSGAIGVALAFDLRWSGAAAAVSLPAMAAVVVGLVHWRERSAVAVGQGAR